MHRGEATDPFSRYRRISIASFAYEENFYDAVVHVGPNFDENGNEIVTIENINIKMDTRFFGSELTEPPLEEIENLMFFTYTGIKALGRYTTLGS